MESKLSCGPQRQGFPDGPRWIRPIPCLETALIEPSSKGGGALNCLWRTPPHLQDFLRKITRLVFGKVGLDRSLPDDFPKLPL